MMKKGLLYCLYSVFFLVGGIVVPLFAANAAIILQQTDYAAQSSDYGPTWQLLGSGLSGTMQSLTLRVTRTSSISKYSGMSVRCYYDVERVTPCSTAYWNSSNAPEIIQGTFFYTWNFSDIVFEADKYYYFFYKQSDPNAGQFGYLQGTTNAALYPGGECQQTGSPNCAPLKDYYFVIEGVAGEYVIPPPVITSPANGATINAPTIPVSGTCDVIDGYTSVFLENATGTQLLSEGFATCSSGVWTTPTYSALTIFQGGQEVRAFLAEDANLWKRSTSSNIITLWGGADAVPNNYTVATTTSYDVVVATPNITLREKFFKPFTFFRDFKNQIDALSLATSSAFYLGASTTAMMTYFFTPLRTGFNIVLFLLFGVYCIKRIAGMVI